VAGRRSRAALTGILFVLKSGIPSRDASGRDGLRLWDDVLAAPARLAAGWDLGAPAPRSSRPLGPRQCHRLEPGGAGQREHPGEKGGEETGPSPTDRGRPGTKRHILTDAGGIPLALTLSPANIHDSQRFERVIDAVPPMHRPAAPRPRLPEGDGGAIKLHGR
jgi:transposase